MSNAVSQTLSTTIYRWLPQFHHCCPLVELLEHFKMRFATSTLTLLLQLHRDCGALSHYYTVISVNPTNPIDEQCCLADSFHVHHCCPLVELLEHFKMRFATSTLTLLLQGAIALDGKIDVEICCLFSMLILVGFVLRD
jgi:hypothetical protein